MIAALFVEEDGVYSGLQGVDVWGISRDARLYAGPWPVVAHPPCARWCRLAGLVEARWGHKRGEDGGCFAAALGAVRQFGGVLEHPAYSDAWHTFELPDPPRQGGWVRGLCGGWAACVEQGKYGHPAKKLTWLYAYGVADLPSLPWGSPSDSEGGAWVSWCGNHTRGAVRPRVGKRAAAATPPAFRDLALSQYDTPRLLAERLARWAGAKTGMRVLEPSAGLGHLAKAAQGLGSSVTCVEIDPARSTYLELEGFLVVNKDFLQAAVAEHDLALMNPPYESDQDALHILRALHFCPRVVALVRLAFLAGEGRYERVWGKHTLTRLAVLTTRPKFSGLKGTGTFDSCVVEIVRGREFDRQVSIEWWG